MADRQAVAYRRRLRSDSPSQENRRRPPPPSPNTRSHHASHSHSQPYSQPHPQVPPHSQPQPQPPPPPNSQLRAAAPAPAEPFPQRIAAPVRLPRGATAGVIYDVLCGRHDDTAGGSPPATKEEVLPPGWERVAYRGTVVYLDHVSREAHEEKPWEVWRRRTKA